MPIRLVPFALALGALIAVPVSLQAQDEEREPGWYDQAELSFVLTGGNTSATTFGLRNELERLFDRSSLKFRVGGLRVESGTDTRVAVGSAGDFEILDDDETELTAENYFANLRYDYDISDRTYVYGLGGWERNRFSGFDDRWTAAAGLGRKLIDNARTTFQIDLGATLTNEQPVVGDSETFAGLRFAWDLEHAFTETTTFRSVLTLDENLKNTSDFRGVFDNSISVDISQALALKSGLVLSYANEPRLEEVPLVPAPGEPATGTVLAPLEELDTVFTIALVVNL